MDMYAQYVYFDYLTLDGNGGDFSMLGGGTEKNMNYEKGEVFMPDYSPSTSDRRLKFGGWATTPDAKEPDIKIGYDLCQDLPKRIYAVYTERILVTFDGNGGYFLSNPENKVYRCTKGKGHVFDGMSLYNEDPLMKPYGWEDQNGVFIPYTIETDPDYIHTGETYLTAVWSREIRVRGNGGYFLDMEEAKNMRMTRLADDYFIVDFGHPTSFDPDMEFAGWATEPDMTEPNVFEGQTKMMDLTEVYAIWKAK